MVLLLSFLGSFLVACYNSSLPWDLRRVAGNGRWSTRYNGRRTGGLGLVVAKSMQLLEVRISHSFSSYVHSIKGRTIVAIKAGGVLGYCHSNRIFQILLILVDNPFAPDLCSNFFFVATVSDEFLLRWEIDTIDVGVSNRRSRGAEVNILGTGVTGHLYNLSCSSTTDDRVVYKEYVSSFKLCPDGVELEANGLFALCLSGHDEGSSNVSVLHETFTERSVQAVCCLKCTRSRSIGHWDNNVNAMVGTELLEYLFGKFFSHVETCLVHTDAINDGIGTGKVDVFEDARSMSGRLVHNFGMAVSFHVDEDGFSGTNITNEFESQSINGNGLG
mmetsp:Transcript_10850/g.19107  ORF Transcript_10850/g.19107 Transcript_10850/m.19107 type:complete len:331 (+) Transcript_10850:286-1278(+)